MKTFQAVITVLLALFCSTALAGPVEFQDFLNDPTPDGWAGFGNTGSGGYGWQSASSNATGVAGEAGGTVDGSGGNAINYYADTSLGGTLTLNDAFSASFWVWFDSQGGNGPGQVVTGFFNKADAEADTWRNYWGLKFSDKTATSLRFQPIGAFGGETQWYIPFSNSGYAELTQYFFTESYSPSGNGTVSFTIDDDADSGNGVLESDAYALTAAERASGATFDAFGIYNYETGRTDEKLVFNFDDATYSVVPEPSTFVLAALGLLGLAPVTWRKRRSP